MNLSAKISRLIKTRGMIGSVAYIFRRFYQRFLKILPPYRINSKYACYPLLCRPGTSDIKVFEQIFVEREYSCVDELSDVNLIIDCGANVGYSSVYLLNQFEKSFLIAIEADPNNYLMMTKNLKPYNNRVKTLNAGVWSDNALLTMSESVYRDGEAWSRQVRECRPGETAFFSGVEIGTVLTESGYDRISILKMDIEGAEAIVFASPVYKMWIDKVDSIVIELHDDSSFGKCSEIFFSAIEKEGFNISHCGELTVCKRRSIK